MDVLSGRGIHRAIWNTSRKTTRTAFKNIQTLDADGTFTCVIVFGSYSTSIQELHDISFIFSLVVGSMQDEENMYIIMFIEFFLKLSQCDTV